QPPSTPASRKPTLISHVSSMILAVPLCGTLSWHEICLLDKFSQNVRVESPPPVRPAYSGRSPGLPPGRAAPVPGWHDSCLGGQMFAQVEMVVTLDPKL